MAHPPEARTLARHTCGQRCFHRCPEKLLARELLDSRVDLARPQRLASPLEYQYHGLKYRAHPGGNRARFTRIGPGFTEQLVVERA